MKCFENIFYLLLSAESDQKNMCTFSCECPFKCLISNFVPIPILYLKFVPTSESLSVLSQSFATFFSDKIHKLHSSLLLNHARSSPLIPQPVTPPHFSSIAPVTMDTISKLLSDSSETYCDLDPIPTSLLKQCSSVFLPTITNIINLSLSTSIFPDQVKYYSFHPHIKKPSFDKETLANYRPVSHLSYQSKLTEKVVKARLTEHLSNNNLFNPFLSCSF